ncbi:MAG: hypothetical protein ACI4OJ_08765, partial [Lachnospiraceae bacterium]
YIQKAKQKNSTLTMKSKRIAKNPTSLPQGFCTGRQQRPNCTENLRKPGEFPLFSAETYI